MKRPIQEMMKRTCWSVAAILFAAALSGCPARAGFSAANRAPGAGSRPVQAGLDAAFLEEAGLDAGPEILRLEAPAALEARPDLGLPAADESSRKPEPVGKIIEIREKMFIAQTNDVYLNPEDYMGKTIKLEGIFKTETGYGDASYCFVIRYGPGCCGYDGNAGFEVAWDKSRRTYPAEDSWVEAVGILSSYDEDGFPYLYLALSDLTVKEKRGAEFVNQ